MVRFQLREPLARLVTEVQEVTHSIILEAEHVYETDEPAVIAKLRALADMVDELPGDPAGKIAQGIADAVESDLDVLDPVGNAKGGKA